MTPPGAEAAQQQRLVSLWTVTNVASEAPLLAAALVTTHVSLTRAACVTAPFRFRYLFTTNRSAVVSVAILLASFSPYAMFTEVEWSEIDGCGYKQAVVNVKHMIQVFAGRYFIIRGPIVTLITSAIVCVSALLLKRKFYSLSTKIKVAQISVFFRVFIPKKRTLAIFKGLKMVDKRYVDKIIKREFRRLKS